MKFLTMVKAGAEYEAGAPPSPELVVAMEKLTEELTKSGVMIEAGGLLPSAFGALVRVKDQKVTVIDGPFTETKELIGGYAFIRTRSKEEAIEHTRRFMALHLEILGSSYTGECEIRQVFDPEDFPAES